MTHPDNKIYKRLIHKQHLKYYEEAEKHYKGNLIQRGRALFKIHKVTDNEKTLLYKDYLDIEIEYDPNYTEHLFRAFSRIGYKCGYDMGLIMGEIFYKKKIKNQTNEAVN